MDQKETSTRREFITKIASAGAAIPFASVLGDMSMGNPGPGYPLRIFSKPLDSYDFGFMCECISRAGIGGIDLTVRPGGKVEPADVETKLPDYVTQAKKYNLALDMIVTGILSPSDMYTEKILKTASSAGIKYYRLGWAEYDQKTGIWETLQVYRPIMARLAEMNRKFNIHGGYQNHAGARVGGPVWDLHELLRNLPPEYMGCQYDVRHATVEGANTWILGMKLMAPYIKTLAIKDVTWIASGGKPEPVTVPLGEGIVNWDLFFKSIRELNISGPFTLHVEYPLLEKGEDKLPLKQQQDIIVSKLRKDVEFLKKYMLKYSLA